MNYTSIKGKVIKGNKIGRQLGFPTANISTSEALPEKGVYVAEIRIKGQNYYGIANIGTRPTLHLSQLTVEVHILNFSDYLYDQIIEITPLQYIRKEMKFKTMKALQLQMENDKVFTLHWIQSHDKS
ncbi:MAG: riboflavin kinase [Bacteroidales bacterium]|nr:riboflavin kinase [Bacteroidales bacterium]MDD4209208.1 riboflavin kinase [Bacteroidales bacterium]